MTSDGMPSPSTVTTLDDALICRLIGAATRRVVMVSPGVSVKVADSLAAAWQRLPANSVSVILDVDAEVCRLGYGAEKSISILQAAASARGQTLCHEPGVRIGLLVVDDQTVVFSPTPLLIECSVSDSKPPVGGELDLSAAPSAATMPNAIFLGAPPAALAAELGLDVTDPSQRTLGLDPVNSAKLGALAADLAANPPLSFDVARYERVFNARIEFVELSVTGCSVSKKTISLPDDLLPLAVESKNRQRVQAKFRVLDENDTIGGDKELSERAILNKRKQIAETYLKPLKGFGVAILRSNRAAFEKEVEELRKLVNLFSNGIRAKLEALIAQNVESLVNDLLPALQSQEMFPRRWIATLGLFPSPDQCRQQLTRDILHHVGNSNDLVEAMAVTVVFKGITYQTLKQPEFIALASKAFPSLPLSEEYNAARSQEGPPS